MATPWQHGGRSVSGVTAVAEDRAGIAPGRDGRPSILRNTDPSLRHGWHPVAFSAAVGTVPLRAALLGEFWWLSRSADGQPSALNSDGTSAAAVTDHLGQVWVSPLPPIADLIPAPERGDPSFVCGWLPVADTTAAAGLILDNQLDVSHFPFVHAGTFGDPSDVLVPPYTITRTPGGFTAVVEHAFRNVQDPGVARGIRPIEQVRRVSYTFALPMQLHLRIDHLQTGQRTVILFGLTPRDDGDTRFTTCLLRNDITGEPGDAVARMPELLAFEQRVVLEDLRLQERFEVPGLPLATELELPIRADACGLELRRQLRALVDGADPTS
jgi:phenylpropionate dioxygenase-like ring-hydroxylating dioxygenase large terminal subunit